MHQKHPKLSRPSLGHYARTEYALVGSTCKYMEGLMEDWAAQFAPDYRTITVTGKHDDSDVPVALRVDRKIFTTDRDDWNEYDDRLLAGTYDLAFVNGNHYPGARQIVFVDEKKAGTLERRREQLTDIFAVVNLDGGKGLPPWLKEMCKAQPVPPILTTASILHHILDGIGKALEEARPRLHGLILAGGRSTRMGQDKSQLVYRQGQNEVERLADLCRGLHVAPHVSVRNAEDAEAHSLPAVVDRFVDMGPAGAIASALMSQPDAAWLVLACDLPLLDADTLEQLIDARRPDRFATAARGPGKEWPEPLVAIYEPRAYPRLLQFLGLGYSCPRKMLINSDVEVLELASSGPLTNVNTPEERDRILQRC